jgi:hypothetical protein
VELIGLYLVAAGLLIVAGVAKAIHPDDTARAIGGSVRPMRWMVRFLATFEVVVGLAALARPGTLTGALVAASYAFFAGVVATVRVRGGPLATCGCFGRPDTPATWLHVGINLLFAAAAAAVAVASWSGSLITVLGHQPAHGLPLLFASAVALWLTVQALSTLPRLESARRQRAELVGAR